MNSAAGAAALTPLAPLPPGTQAPPDTVRFDSRGAVLVIGDDDGIAEAVAAVARQHRTAAVAPGIDALRWPPRVTPLGLRVAALHGHLGAFRAQVQLAEGRKDIGAASPNADGLFDLVLDLGRQPLLGAAPAPPGYFAPGADPAARAAAITTMGGLVGSFTQPRWVQLQGAWCVHGRSGHTGCARCLQACPTAAITSLGDTVRIDAHRCQGCAGCALACPTGALEFRLPARDALRQQLVDALGRHARPGPLLVVHGQVQAATVAAAIAGAYAIAIAVDPLPAFGEELWLDALALGVAALALVADPAMAPATRARVEAGLAQGRALLQALGLAVERLAGVAPADLAAWVERHRPAAGARSVGPAMAVPAANRLPAPKRAAQLDATARLRAASASPVHAAPEVALAAGGSFGDVQVERARCTLCFACVNLCPTGALLQDAGALPRLRLAEAACVQCSLCAKGCPEQAITLRPRCDPQALARGGSRVLDHDTLQPCATCGTPFISRKLLAASLRRLADHPVLAPGGRARLMTCPACRQRGLLAP